MEPETCFQFANGMEPQAAEKHLTHPALSRALSTQSKGLDRNPPCWAPSVSHHAVSDNSENHLSLWACLRGSKNWPLLTDEETEAPGGRVCPVRTAAPRIRSSSVELLVLCTFLSTIHPFRQRVSKIPSFKARALDGLHSVLHSLTHSFIRDSLCLL